MPPGPKVMEGFHLTLGLVLAQVTVASYTGRFLVKKLNLWV